MKSFLNTLLILLGLCALVVPSHSYAQKFIETDGNVSWRGFTPREMEPLGQMRSGIYEQTATFRLIRTQEERRPRDARALGPQDLGDPGVARPELINSIRRNRKKGYGGGWLWQDVGDTADQNEGWTPLEEEPGDYQVNRQGGDLTATEWWEQKFRGQGQRGGWFRARFGSSGGTSIQGGGGGTSSQSQPQQPSQQSSGGMGSGGMGGMGGMGGGR